MVATQSRLLLGLVAAHLLAGCSVDERRLARLASYSNGADAGTAGEGAGAWGGCGDGGAAGSPAMLGCWSFDHDVESWQADPEITRKYSHDDADGDEHSGSLSLANTYSGDDEQILTSGAFQCLPVSYATAFTLKLAVRVPAQPVAGGASVELQFLNTASCQGIILDHPQWSSRDPLTWESIDESGEVPRGTRSALLRLLVGKIRGEPNFVAHFDQVRLVVE